jgi:hypothetical protein
MIRTVWLAAVCLIVLGAMAVGKVTKIPAPTNDDTLVDGPTVGADLIQEPLSKADGAADGPKPSRRKPKPCGRKPSRRPKSDFAGRDAYR